MLPFSLLPLLPLGGLLGMVHSILVFRKDYRCGHDMLAGTRVVQAE